jgi:DNA-binding PadR family transcriptional regulator
MTTLGYALLSLLACESLSGYDLAQTMKSRVSYFWHARHSQIYPELAKLEQQGYVLHTVVEQQDRPDKKLYTITEEGIAQLRQWVVQDTEVPGVRDELVLKAYSLWLADPQQAIELFRQHEQRHIQQRAEYEQLATWIQNCWESDGRRLDSRWFGSYATLQRGLGFEKEYIAWCHWVIETLGSSQAVI